MSKSELKKISIGILGMGYVGLPLAIEFGKKFIVKGFDKNIKRINQLNKYFDSNHDISKSDFKKSKNLEFTKNISDLKNCNTYIVSVPTPIDSKNQPDLNLLTKACSDLSVIIKNNDTVIFESTVYPGLTEEICVPILEKNSGLELNKNLFIGYSPERINPNDKKHKLKNIVKITSGSNKKTSKFVDTLYKSIITSGTYNVDSIRIAEAAKVIENAQRDLNIAFVNELAIIFDKLNINTNSVLKAASTKWNFLNFSPGLVGGHCIGVDPYYLTYKSSKAGYKPKIITAGRQINNNFVDFIYKKALNNTKKVFKSKNIKFLIMGAAFKEDCLDFRNSKSIDLYKKIKKNKFYVDLFDPLVDENSFYKENKFKLISKLKSDYYNCVIIAVAHKKIKYLGQKKIRSLLKKNGVLFDVKNIFSFNDSNLYI